MAELDTKQKVLVAIYTEYQKDIPQMEKITANSLGLQSDQFAVAIQKLENERLITGPKYSKGGRGVVPLMVVMDFVMVTNYGLQYVEEKLDIKPTMSAQEKLVEVTKKVTSWGYSELKDFAIKVTTELIKSQMPSQN